jgi:hypothetical protein
MVTAVEAGPCPICEKSHGELSESPQTKLDAGGLAAKFEAEVRPIIEEVEARGADDKLQVSTMLGIVACKCGTKYADQSAATTAEFCKAAKGMKHPADVTLSYRDGRPVLDGGYLESLKTVRERIGAHLGNSSLFEDTWERAESRAADSDRMRKKDPSNTPAAYPPGTCAAQKTLLLLMDDGALAGAMTEQWYSSRKSKTQAPIRYVDARGGTRAEVVGKFKHGDTVPPCGACELLVPLLRCAGDKTKCDHKT